MACNPYADVIYWVLGYAEEEADCGVRGFAGWSYTEEELRELAIADQRRRIGQQIRELERQLALERAWAETTTRDEIRALEQRRTKT